jgi:hypothetical protein
MRGMVGLADTDRGLALAPQLPPGWDFLRLRNLRWRDAAADVELRRTAEGIQATMTPRKGAMTVDVAVPLTAGAELVSSTARGSDRVSTHAAGADPLVGEGRLTLSAASPRGVVRMRPGITLTADQRPLAIGDESRRLRVVETSVKGGVFTARLQGLRGETYRLSLDAPFELLSIAGAKELLPRDGRVRRLELAIPRGEREWVDATLTVKLGKRRQ